MKTVAIIPARMNSTRCPGKPMRNIHGMPMIGHVYCRTKMATNVDLVCVATCDQEIFDYVESIGGIAVMTSESHERASDRTAEALLFLEHEYKTKFDVVAMIQGDEPLVWPKEVEIAVNELEKDSSINIVNLMSIIETDKDFKNYNDVKVVVNLKGDALYFSREPIPSAWHADDQFKKYKQFGLIFFRRDYLLRFNELDQTPLEIAESVDMMRVLENGEKVRMLEVMGKNIGVDTPEEFDVAEEMMVGDPLLEKYL